MEIPTSVLETYARLTQELHSLERAVDLRKRLRMWCHMNMYELELVGKTQPDAPAAAVRIRNRMYPEFVECVGEHLFPLQGFRVYLDQLQVLLQCLRSDDTEVPPIDIPVAIYSQVHGEPLAERDMFDLGVVKVEGQHFLSVRMCGSGEELDFPIGLETVTTLLETVVAELQKS